MHGATVEGWGEGSGVQSHKSLPLVDVLLLLSLTSVLVYSSACGLGFSVAARARGSRRAPSFNSALRGLGLRRLFRRQQLAFLVSPNTSVGVVEDSWWVLVYPETQVVASVSPAVPSRATFFLSLMISVVQVSF